MWKELKGVDAGISCWVDTDQIDTVQYINPRVLQSDLIQIPGLDDKKDTSVITTRSGNKLTVQATPKEIFEENN
jgi:hypothetical protein